MSEPTASGWPSIRLGFHVALSPSFVAMMLITADRSGMGESRVSGTLRILGWLTAGAMVGRLGDGCDVADVIFSNDDGA